MNVPKEYIKNTAMVWVGFLLLFVFIYAFTLKPQVKKKNALGQKLQQAKQDYENVVKMSDKDTRDKLAKEIEELREKMRGFVTDMDGSVNLTFDISRLAKSSNVSAFSIKSRNHKKLFDIPGCNVVGENRMEVDFRGDFRQFARLLNQLERHDPVVFVDKFSIMDDRTGEGASNRINMDLSVFVEKKQES